MRILRRSIDARQRTIFVNLKVRCYVNEQPTDDEYVPTVYPNVSDRQQVIVVGAGPGGLFAALRLIELGLRPIVLERGKDVRERKKDLALIAKNQQVDAESNYCFGEGGAASMVPRPIFLLTLIHISELINCRVSLRICVIPSCAVVARYTSRPK